MALNGIVQFNTNGTSAFPKTPEEIVKEKLIFLLTTHRGDRENNNSFGSNLHHLSFLPNDVALQQAADKEVRNAIQEFMPFVIVDQVSAVKESNNGLVQYKVEYTLASGFEDNIEFSL